MVAIRFTFAEIHSRFPLDSNAGFVALKEFPATDAQVFLVVEGCPAPNINVWMATISAVEDFLDDCFSDDSFLAPEVFLASFKVSSLVVLIIVWAWNLLNH